MKMIRFSQTFWHCVHGASVPQFEAGKDYPADNAEAQRCIARGIAEEVDVPDEPAEEAKPAADGAEPAADAKPAKAKK